MFDFGSLTNEALYLYQHLKIDVKIVSKYFIVFNIQISLQNGKKITFYNIKYENNIKYEHSLIKIADRGVQGFLNLIPKPEHRVLNSFSRICLLI